jgi:hypothetical protein
MPSAGSVSFDHMPGRTAFQLSGLSCRRNCRDSWTATALFPLVSSKRFTTSVDDDGNPSRPEICAMIQSTWLAGRHQVDAHGPVPQRVGPGAIRPTAADARVVDEICTLP